MRWLKRFIFILGLALLALLAALTWYLLHLPTVAPQTVTALPSSQTVQGCLAQTPRAAYQVSALTRTDLAGQSIHQLSTEFVLQFEARGADVLAGIAEQIQVIENQQAPQSLPSVTLLTRAAGEQQLTFMAFNALGLPAEHPLQVLGQLLKQLSVGKEGEAYRFAYDQMGRIYRYQNRTHWQRTVSVPGQLQAAELAPRWDIILATDCWPQQLQAQEVQPLTINGQAGQLLIEIRAQRIANFKDLSGLDFSAAANRAKHWQGVSVVLNSGVKKPANEQQAWQQITEFAANKNMQQLLQTSTYWVVQVPAAKLAVQLVNPELDALARDLLFGIGSLPSAASKQYLMDLLEALPAGSNVAELQKVRTMVALSGHVHADDKVYQRYQNLLADQNETNNIKNNALINMGRVVQSMAERGHSSDSVRQQLEQTLQQELNSAQKSAAIFAAGNAGLNTLTSAIKTQINTALVQGNTKERFAAATVLSRDVNNYEALKQRVSAEPSALVKNTIIDGLTSAGISTAQQAELKQLAGSH